MADTHDRPIILRPGEGRSIDLGNFQMSVKAAEKYAMEVIGPVPEGYL